MLDLYTTPRFSPFASEVKAYVDNLPLDITRWAFVLLLLSTPFIVTRVYTGLRSAFPSYTEIDGQKVREPMQVPYWIPFLGNLFSVVSDFEGFLTGLKYKYNSAPVTLSVLGLKIYITTSPHDTHSVYRKSATLSFDKILLHVIKTVCGIHPRGLGLLKIGAHGIPQRPGITEEEIRAQEITANIHKGYAKYLSGPYVEHMTKMFQEVIIAKISGMVYSGECNGLGKEVELADWVQRTIYEASITVLFGKHLLRICPDLYDDMWAFDPEMPIVALGFPRWLKSGPYERRDRMLRGFARWQEFAIKSAEEEGLSMHIEDGDGQEERYWDEYYGSTLTRERIHLFTSRGLDSIGSASIHFVFFFALLTNVIPSTTWMLIHTMTTPEIIPQLREEIAKGLVELDEKGATISTQPLRFDIRTLNTPEASPLLNSVFNESLRLSVSIFSLRAVLADTEIDNGIIVKEGGFVIAPTRLLQLDKQVWDNSSACHGSGRENQFWAQRFLTSSGKNELRDRDRANRPFGGGLALCPGRFMAKNEILSLYSTILTVFDVVPVKVGKNELHGERVTFKEPRSWNYGSAVDEGSNRRKDARGEVGVNNKYFGLGGMPPDREVWVRFKVRN